MAPSSTLERPRDTRPVSVLVYDVDAGTAAPFDDDLGIDWLTGEYTSRKARLERELDRLNSGCWCDLE